MRLKSRIANLLLALASTVASLIAAEIGLRMFAPQPMNGSVFEYALRGYLVIKSSGTALFSVGDRRGVYHFMTPHLRGMLSIDSAAARVLALGDSFTFGVGLSDEETYVAKLQGKLDTSFGIGRVVLLNAGIGGSGTAEHLAYLEDFGDQISPRAVVVFVGFDDFNRAERSPLYRLRSPSTLELDEAMVPTSSLKKTVLGSNAYNFIIEHLHIAQLARSAVLRVLFPPDRGPTKTLPRDGIDSKTTVTQQALARALFIRMKRWCDVHNAAFAVINNGWQRYDWLMGLLESEKISAFDAAPKVKRLVESDPESYVIPADGHPNPKGAALIADTAWPFLEDFVRKNAL